MNHISIHTSRSGLSFSLNNLACKTILLLVIILAGLHQPTQAQTIEYTTPSWYFGIAAGANFNFYRGSTQQLNADFTAPVAFDHGNGAALYLAPLVEYHHPTSGLGFMFQTGYDSRSSAFTQQITPCNCPADLSTTLSYITVEPTVRIAPFHSPFYLYAGPRLAFNIEKSFTYKLGLNPDIPDQEPTPDVKGDLSDVHATLFSMQIGAGYDIPLTSQTRKTQFVLSPFVSFHPYFGQAPRSIETWSVTTLRAGAAFKFGHGRKIEAPFARDVLPLDPDVRFVVNSPVNNPATENFIETFPLRNYIYFDMNSSAIPDRYVQLTKNQVKDFREDDLRPFKPKQIPIRSERQMSVYYNILNILGSRMVLTPSSNITLVGSSQKNHEDGHAIAESVRQYLTEVFGIETTRIAVEGRVKPKIVSEQPGEKLDLELRREGDRRVSVESATPSLLMEFQNGPTAPLKAVEIRSPQEAPLSSYVSFSIPKGIDALSSWSLEVKDEKSVVQKFGPFTQDVVRLPGKTLLGIRPAGDFKVTMVGQTKDGRVIRKESPMHVVLWTPAKTEPGMRYSILYEFDDAKAITMYQKYITDIITPRIPIGGKVVIRGYTDIIGDGTHNLTLSQDRANDVKQIIEASLSKAGRKDVTFQVIGLGEDENKSLFDNKYPEERAYNRTVVIDILPVN